MMKIFSFILLIITGFLGAQVRNQIAITPDAKVGLSLAGGGAKGFAHVGALKVLDSLGVKIDYISGTSMGAIVGGLYASGYTGKEIEKIILNTDFYKIIANEKNRKETPFFNKTNDRYMFTFPIKDGKVIFLPKAISTGQKNVYMLNELLKNTSNVEDFSKMPIPFMCVATNLETGEKKIFQKGNLVNAIMASAAYPSLMDPVKIGDSLYIDGAMTMNYPSEPLKKKKGMDIVVGVDLSQELAKREDLQSAVSILNQVIDFGIQEETKNQYLYTDINIHPNLDGLDATSYGDKKRILDSGYAETLKYVDILNKLPKRKVKYLRPKTNDIFQNVYRIDSLEVLQSKVFNKAYIQGKMNLKLPSIQTYGTINKMIDKLYATNNYNLINYDIIQSDNHNILKLTVTEDKSRFFIKLGLHYDEVFKSGFLVNATAKRFLFRNSITSFDVVLGDNPRYYFNYVIDNGYIPGGGISASGMQLSLKDSKGDIFEKWNWFRSDIFVQSVWKDRYAIGGGLSLDLYKIQNNGVPTKKYFNSYVFIKSDTQDDKNFPTRGIYMDAEGKIIDLFNEDIDKKPIQVKGDLRFNFPIAKFLTYQLNLFGGFTLNDQQLPAYYLYRPGGIFEQKVNNFIGLNGYYFGSLSSSNVLIARQNLQFKFDKNYFIIANADLANIFEEINMNQILQINHSSLGITVGYKSPFGQIRLNYSKALNPNKGMFNVVLGHWF
ncbi:patatin-like phospholipase family protein [Riemerella columbipharyngis]|uniref:NTE family protein n=1 Tax=Riemerella columbipharyngis TaxID=1071918 RepID=A0A1G7DIY2_9FLAO|nr:patatin-like phospholipase family protein [Riemerella columbipharyngis]SDE50715.1 NTE family protein [Riemerella columbipharyngis]